MFANIHTERFSGENSRTKGIGDIDEAYKYIETNNTKQEFIEAI